MLHLKKTDNLHHVVSTVNILQQSHIKMLIKDEKLPHDLIVTLFNDLSSKHKETARISMPQFLHGVDGGGNNNNMHLQNLLAHISGHFLMRFDKTCVYRSCPSHSYLNTAERGMPICNLALENHGFCIDPNVTM